MVDFSGVAVVDSTGWNIASSSTQTVPGLYAQIDRAYKSKKAIIFINSNSNGAIASPRFMYAIPSTNAYILAGGVSVSTADVLTHI